MGLWLDSWSFTVQEVTQAVHVLATSGSFRQQAVKLHELVEDEETGGGSIAGVKFVEHLMRFGNKHLVCEQDFQSFWLPRFVLWLYMLLPVLAVGACCRCSCCRSGSGATPLKIM